MTKQTNLISLNKLIFILFLVLGFTHCNTNKLTKKNNKNYIYDTKIKDLNPEFFVYHVAENESYLYFKILTKELLYTRENSEKPFESTVKIKYEIYKTEAGKILVDSNSKELIDYKTSKDNKVIVGRLPLKIAQGSNAVMRVEIEDVNKQTAVDEIIKINKTDKKSGQYFLLKKNNSICFDSYFNTKTNLDLESEMNQNFGMEMKVFYRSNKIARPPFSRDNIFLFPDTADEIRPVTFVNGKASFTMDSLGSYFFKSKDNEKISFVFEKFNTNYSQIENYSGMIEPLKYICSSAEYEMLQSSENKREAIEEFWIKIAGSKGRAKVLISEYYRRVEGANKYFTSYKEGWKTDRGMISIVFGMPNSIFKTKYQETWIFGTQNNMVMSLSFSFNKENSEILKNDYQLKRYRSFRNQWYRALETWRGGRIYTFN